jgi:hypothetical protein
MCSTQQEESAAGDVWIRPGQLCRTGTQDAQRQRSTATLAHCPTGRRSICGGTCRHGPVGNQDVMPHVARVHIHDGGSAHLSRNPRPQPAADPARHRAQEGRQAATTAHTAQRTAFSAAAESLVSLRPGTNMPQREPETVMSAASCHAVSQQVIAALTSPLGELQLTLSATEQTCSWSTDLQHEVGRRELWPGWHHRFHRRGIQPACCGLCCCCGPGPHQQRLILCITEQHSTAGCWLWPVACNPALVILHCTALQAIHCTTAPG